MEEHLRRGNYVPLTEEEQRKVREAIQNKIPRTTISVQLGIGLGRLDRFVSSVGKKWVKRSKGIRGRWVENPIGNEKLPQDGKTEVIYEEGKIVTTLQPKMYGEQSEEKEEKEDEFTMSQQGTEEMEMSKELFEKDLKIQRLDLERVISDSQTATDRRFEKMVERMEQISNMVGELGGQIKTFVSGTEKISSQIENQDEQIGKLRGDLPTLTDLEERISRKIEPIASRLSQLPDEEKVKSLVNECMTNPESSACSILAKKLKEQQAAESTQEEEEEEEEGDGVHHRTASDYFDCPECGPLLRGYAIKQPAFRESVLSELSESEMESLLKNLEGVGYKIQGPKGKTKGDIFAV